MVKAARLLFGLLLAGVAASGQDTNLLSVLEPDALFPELRMAAAAEGVPLDGLVPAASTNRLAPGDSLTALITLHRKGNHRTEWLVYFQVVPATNDPPKNPPKPEVLYNSAGDKFEFARSPVTFHIRTLGPYADAASFWGKPVAKAKNAQVSVNAAFLSLGLDQGAAAINRLRRADCTNFNFWVSPWPPAARKAQENQKVAAEYHMTSEEKRALAGWFPTLMSYFQAVGETPDLDTILWKIVSLPSMWSIVRQAGVTVQMGLDFDHVSPLTVPARWGVPVGSAVFALPIKVELNQQPALDATLLVTDPRPALLACGGIVAFVALNPGDDQNYATLRVISTRWGASAKGK